MWERMSESWKLLKYTLFLFLKNIIDIDYPPFLFLEKSLFGSNVEVEWEKKKSFVEINYKNWTRILSI
jgi:hypothetical protein